MLKGDFLSASADRDNIKKLLSFSSFVGIARVLTSLAGKLDVIMLLAITGNPVETAVYSIAARFAFLYPILSGSFSTVIAPRFASIKSKDELNNYLTKVIFATLALIGTILLLILLAGTFPVYTFGFEKAQPSIPVFRFLLMAMIFFVGSIPR